MSSKQTRMLDYLLRAPGWVTAGELADLLGVTPRSVRSYVTNVKAAAHPLNLIESGPAGYLLNRDAYAAFTTVQPQRPVDTDTPQNRLYQLVRRLTDGAAGLDVYELAADMFVSDSTIEADLGRVRALLPDSGLSLSRHGSVVSLVGSETDRRRLLSRMFRDESKRGLLELAAIQREFASESLEAFKTDLITMLDTQGYFVNEFGTNNVLLHVAIAVDRVGKRDSPDAAAPDPSIASTTATSAEMTAALSALIDTHFGVALDDGDIAYLIALLKTRVVTPGNDQPTEVLAQTFARPDDLAVVRRIVSQASEEYLVDLADDDFITRLTLHVRNLIDRAQVREYSRNPLTRSIKTSYPMTYELAVFIASELQRHEQILINDDEIAYIAMHVGSHLEQQSHTEEHVTCVIVCPNYYTMHVQLRQRIERVLGDDLTVVAQITRSDVHWDDLHADLVLTTIEPPVPAAGVLVIQPFLTEGDIDRIRRAAIRVRRLRRRAQIKDDLLQFFDESLFLRNFYVGDEEAMIRELGARMMRHGVIDEAYVHGALERERMSSTAFTDNLAVPHAMAMTAQRTSIAIVVNDSPMDWGDSRVTVVALIAFSAAGRASFQAVFDQFVEVFTDRADVQHLIRSSVDFPSFIDSLVHLMDK
ncbi:BglG family transcription antiterminator [Cryobacterium psychrophilum]|uniref:Transcription antiterminator n=1 Tax=Cryobacterium psychrophilum TaxID=41988 RepID=A0A4Y8KRC7_9MICO|nr:BglG family transcription antiterminator [Cryobacterium psychrophilum]TDW29694.1 BglG family transcriptional antiterminator [Cryobacterium psychrophilum]TFD81803.1 transcription antiterminator [Cryobacterium psychrophilum]